MNKSEPSFQSSIGPINKGTLHTSGNDKEGSEYIL